MHKLSISLVIFGLIAGFIQNATSNVIGIGSGINCANNLIGNGLAFNGIAPGNVANLALGSNIGNIANFGLDAGVGSIGNLGLGNGLVPVNAGPAIGVGDVAIGGELPVGGATSVRGNVPVIGYVTFEGTVPAGGIVSVAPGCGCNQIVP